MKIDDKDHPGVREVLDTFGDEAVKLHEKLRNIPEGNISERLVAIAYALWSADLKATQNALKVLDSSRSDDG
jgi:hypothetical protein